MRDGARPQRVVHRLPDADGARHAGRCGCRISETPHPHAPYGLNGVGEMPTIASTPAVVAAVRDATGRELPRVPLTPGRRRRGRVSGDEDRAAFLGPPRPRRRGLALGGRARVGARAVRRARRPPPTPSPRSSREAPPDEQLALIRAHPDLAGRAALAGELTADSAARAGLRRPRPPDPGRPGPLHGASTTPTGSASASRSSSGSPGRSVAEILAAYERAPRQRRRRRAARRDRGDRRDHAAARSRRRRERRPGGARRRVGRRGGGRPDRRGRPGAAGRARGDRRPRAARAAGGGRRPRPPRRPRARRLGGLRHRHRARSPPAGSPAAADMPLNSLPPTLDGGLLRRQGRRRPWARPGRLRALGRAGARRPGAASTSWPGAASSGSRPSCARAACTSSPAADPDELGRGMERAAALGLPVAVHAEDPACARLADEARAAGRTYDARLVRLAARRRPSSAVRSRLALALAEQTGCAVHVVHVSSRRGAPTWSPRPARAGVDATCEACPHHLVLDEGDAARIGALAKCAPPLRSAAERRALWARVAGRRDRPGGLGPLARAARAEAGGRHVRGVGRDLRGADHPAAAADPRARRTAWAPRASPRLLRRGARRAGWAWRARAACAPGADADLAHRARRRGLDAPPRRPPSTATRVSPFLGTAPDRAGGAHDPARRDGLTARAPTRARPPPAGW